MAKLTLVPVLVSPKGVRKPVRANYRVYSAFAEVQQFFAAQLGGTFTLGGPVSYTLSETWDEICTRRSPAEINGGNIWLDAMQEGVDRGLVRFSESRAYYLVYFRPPTPRQYLDGFGGMVGVEHWMPFSRPGMACVADEKSWLLAGRGKGELVDAGWELPDWADDLTASVGALAHEVVHIVSDLPHGEAPSITFAWWTGIELPGSGYLSSAEKQALLDTGYFG